MFDNISILPHQEKLFLAYYGTPIPNNAIGNYYKGKQRLAFLLHPKATEKQIQQIIQKEVPKILQQEIHHIFSQKKG